MCLSVPSQVTELHDDASVTVNTLGVKRRVSAHLMTEPLAIGDFVLIHIGFVMNKIDETEANLSLALYKEIVEKLALEEQA
ncbi:MULTISPECIES: HypC/HybG/HupF family hydrogenase formation chaperone [Shewanella]|uniref:HypC/HybG/HupF family hydrogenase formation chaperone n=1 Tax=Shewanella electrodiphila TaxID=934143 RepID=A0ABT0KSI7_9GAMM|nr:MULTISPECIES: HypC/HybG/HupF family hydrogenase formation chaperone [Shewanella]MCL1046815.1 HypC/HybG/HupF family hydrogenase formation chaperone [Shewanella electrodiphila]PMG78101.1 hydrogenase assembly protein HypC [Shewanella sp. 10N.286.51.B7]